MRSRMGSLIFHGEPNAPLVTLGLNSDRSGAQFGVDPICGLYPILFSRRLQSKGPYTTVWLLRGQYWGAIIVSTLV
jgi:hypothetical protein